MKRNTLGILIFCALLIVVGIGFKKLYPTKDSGPVAESSQIPQSKPEINNRRNSAPNSSALSIDGLTRQDVVANYLRQNKRLPDYYVTKKQARSQGWDARNGNLCSVMPGKAIGGDRFSNREGALPNASGRVWFEADINYRCGHRGAERLLYSNDGLIYVTHDHYKRFTEVRNR
ncbi:ribonuclease domain-containing protein [Pragia fontium]|uniref:ribonuclease domain-containing protein n=1 Tax=Pragia fontium TaxID=82985 RepID=UPI000E050BE4|nr:ribonuclease domain-containing protein [Pragia fontium]SUB83742.1 Ribonuclease precursor [Pragia fontium]VEJ56648.1 Ribonuclease precursor [Pragia fontium]